MNKLADTMTGFEPTTTLLTVVAVNQLYGANLYAYHRMAVHICAVLRTGYQQSPQLVERIACLPALAGLNVTPTELDRYLWIRGVYEAWRQHPEAPMNVELRQLFKKQQKDTDSDHPDWKCVVGGGRYSARGKAADRSLRHRNCCGSLLRAARAEGQLMRTLIYKRTHRGMRAGCHL